MMNRHRRAFYPALSALLFMLAHEPVLAQLPASQTDLAITGVNVVPMDSERVLPDQTVLISDGVIAAIGTTSDITVPQGTQIIDGTGQFLMPGLLDLHVHILHKDEFTNYLAWGVTTVMHLGGSGLPGTKTAADA